MEEAYTQFDKKDVHFDASSKADNPKWSMVWFMIVLCVCFYTQYVRNPNRVIIRRGRDAWPETSVVDD